jgi:hypothetical protein
MLTPPRDAQEAFRRLTPDLQEIAEFIGTSLLNARERVRLANLLAEHFARQAREQTRPALRLVPPDAPQGKQLV